MSLILGENFKRIHRCHILDQNERRRGREDAHPLYQRPTNLKSARALKSQFSTSTDPINRNDKYWNSFPDQTLWAPGSVISRISRVANSSPPCQYRPLEKQKKIIQEKKSITSERRDTANLEPPLLKSRGLELSSSWYWSSYWAAQAREQLSYSKIGLINSHSMETQPRAKKSMNH